ncbi:helix-turn-helix domain-containing protein [Pseudobutyrivibrio xylanivorans]|uniref:Helix-turn-helix domain-containing protein n=1 Tax=Pseudobutyrivibrio xylanivorans TaxID=185007 RepID=A0A1G5RQI4_PSEXY|nr:helix-turn-helix domain-containing protein [Pseudobutyrivibrio xylanivorans]SCZ76257.1 Helix-turn-helix domain-containing protein [Pseudobutyrivibrio xylanivorans]
MLDMIIVGKNIKAARTEKNMTQLELADILGVSYQAVSNWERGNSMPDIAKLPVISNALEIEITELLGEDSCAKTIKKVLDENPEPLSSKELTDVAALLPPADFKKEMKKTSEKEILDIKAIVGLAPYLDDEILDDIVSNVDAANVKEIVPLAPYLSDKTLIEISKIIESSMINDLVPLAPFMPDEALDNIVSKIDANNLDKINVLAPFLSDNTLDKIVDKAIEEDAISKLSSSACFLGKKSLKKIANYLVQSDDGKSLSKFAMYI